MRVVKCQNGHYYDGGRNENCSHCNGTEVLDDRFYSSSTQQHGESENTAIIRDIITQLQTKSV